MEKKEKRRWAGRMKDYLQGYVFVEFTKNEANKIPTLVFADDNQAYTDGANEIHIGLDMFDAKSEKDMFWQVFYILGHELQHIHSTRARDWDFGITQQVRYNCNALSKQLFGTSAHIHSRRDLDSFQAAISSKGSNVSVRKLQEFAHFVANALEDGRIEQIRSQKYKTFPKYMVKFRGDGWLKDDSLNGVDPGNLSPVGKLSVILNQVLYQATMSRYEQGFEKIFKGTDLYVKVESLIPTIREAVSAKTCKICMQKAIEIGEALSEETLKAAEMSEFEQFINALASQAMSEIERKANSSTQEKEETGEDNGSPVNFFGEKPDDEKSGNEEGCEDVSEAVKKASESESSEFDQMEKENERAERTKQSAAQLPPKPGSVSEIGDGSFVCDIDMRDYIPDSVLPVQFYNQAEVFRREIQKVLKKKQVPDLRGMKSGIVDGSNIVNLVFSNPKVFRRRQESKPVDTAVYILQDNSGSMGNGTGSSRYYACAASAIVEEGLRGVCPTAITAFDYSERVRHQIVKQFDEGARNVSFSWSYYENRTSGHGNRDDVSIHMATNELAERNEHQKILIVISDGLPCCSADDVHEAVARARSMGIAVIGLFISDDEEAPEEFDYMYDGRTLHATPEDIPSELPRVLKNTIFSR